MADSRSVAPAPGDVRHATSARVRTMILSRIHSDPVIGIGLYALAALVLISPLGDHPPYLYNWEPYAARNVFSFWIDGFRPAQVFARTDGLMTDSGQGPLIGLPIWLGFRLFGTGVDAMRLPVTLLAAGAVPMLWLVGRRLTETPAALLAALLLTLSPVWLLYGRSATQVGISLVPALLTVYVLLGVLKGRRRWIAWLIALQTLLVAGAYAYAPIRFLWPLSLGLIVFEAMRGPHHRRSLAALTVTALVLPVALIGIDRVTMSDSTSLDVVTGYYKGRGEHIFALNKDPDRYAFYLDNEANAETREPAGELARQLIRQNLGDLARLLLDYDTASAVTHFYNPDGKPVGRLYPAVFVPFLAIGVFTSLRRLIARKGREDLVLLTMASSFALPMLLTSHVHIGRLIFALPFLILLVAAAAWEAGRLLGSRLTRIALPVGRRLALAANVTVALVVIAAMACTAWAEEGADVAVPPTVRMEAVLKAHAPRVSASGAALVVGAAAGTTFEAVTVATLRLALDDTYQFMDLREAAVGRQAAGHRELPTLYHGGLLDRLSPELLPDFCALTFFVTPEAEARYLDAVKTIPEDCSGPNRYTLLPG